MPTDTDTTTATRNGPPPPEPAAAPARVSSRPPKLRRRGLLAGGLGLVAAAALAAVFLVDTLTDTHSVLAMSTSVVRGQTITDADLTVASITLDPALAPVASADRDQVVGRRAALDLPAGSIVTAEAVTEAVSPAAGEELVGLAVTPTQLPVEPLAPGDVIRVVDTPRENDDPPEAEPRSTIATVVTVGPLTETGRIIIDVVVPADQAADLAARAATGRIGIVLQSRERN